MKLSLWNLFTSFVKVPGQKFSACKYPVTQSLWRDIATKYPKSGLNPDPSFFKGDDRPVESITFQEIVNFIKHLNIEVKDKGVVYMIPTSDQWEQAAKGGTKTKNFTYAGSNDLDAVGWYYSNSNGQTHPVGEKLPNEIGLYDCSGNVWETCAENDEDFETILNEVTDAETARKVMAVLA